MSRRRTLFRLQGEEATICGKSLEMNWTTILPALHVDCAVCRRWLAARVQTMPGYTWDGHRWRASQDAPDSAAKGGGR